LLSTLGSDRRTATPSRATRTSDKAIGSQPWILGVSRDDCGSCAQSGAQDRLPVK
jgi:hypothetical protein